MSRRLPYYTTDSEFTECVTGVVPWTPPPPTISLLKSQRTGQRGQHRNRVREEATPSGRDRQTGKRRLGGGLGTVTYPCHRDPSRLSTTPRTEWNRPRRRSKGRRGEIFTPSTPCLHFGKTFEGPTTVRDDGNVCPVT